MINNTEAKKIYEVSSGVTEYPIGFVFYFNPDQTPQLSVAIGSDILRLNYNCRLSEDNGSLILMPTEEEAANLTGPDDFSWMDKWDGAHLVIQRDIPFVQESDYQLGRVSPEQIEKDFDLSVMRDQILDGAVKKLRSDTVNEFIATDTRFETVESHIEENANSIRSVREDFVSADQAIRDDMNAKDLELETILNDHTELLNTLRTDHDDLGDDVSEIQAKIPQSASGSNPLITQQQLAAATYTKAEVDAKVSSVYKFKGSVASYGNLPSSAVIGDVYNVSDTGANYAWDGSSWDKLSETIDLSAYAKTEYVDAREQDIRADLGENISEVQTIVEGQAAAIAGKQDKLTAGAGITIDGNTISSTGGGVSGDYLPLSGGSLDDGARINWGSGNASITGVSDSSTGRGVLNIDVGDYTFTFLHTSFYIGGQLDLTIDKKLGSREYPWSTTYTKKLNAGRGSDGTYARDLILPTEGGTLARLEDLEGLGGASLPDQTDNAGKFLMTNGATLSWGEALVNKSTTSNNLLIPSATNSIAAAFKGGIIAFGAGSRKTLTEKGVYFSFGDFGDNLDYIVYKLMDADGNVPLERLTYVTNQIGDISTALTAILGE